MESTHMDNPPLEDHLNMTDTSLPPTKPPSNNTNNNTNTIAIKFLLTNNMAGSIIGRSGQTIAELQADSNARIKISQAGDCYPGTNERTCLIQGPLPQVKLGVELVLHKLYDTHVEYASANLHNPSHSHSSRRSNNSHLPPHLRGNSLNFTVRVLVPSQSCGMLIGRSGSNINGIKEESGVSQIRISSKLSSNDVHGNGNGNSNVHPSLLAESMAIATTSERTLTITSNATSSNTSHEDEEENEVQEEGRGGVDTESPYPYGDVQTVQKCIELILDEGANHPDIFRYINMTTSYNKMRSMGGRRRSGSGSGGGYPQQSHAQPTQQQAPTPPSLEENLQQILNLEAEQVNANRQPQPQAPNPTSSPAAGVIGEVPTPTQTITSATTSTSTASPAANNTTSDTTTNNNTSQSNQKQTYSINIAVEDALVGAILGRRGQTLALLQSKSQTRIKVSQRGEFIPNTHNRIVTIRGNTPESIQIAQLLIQQHLTSSTNGRAISIHGGNGGGGNGGGSGSGGQDDNEETDA